MPLGASGTDFGSPEIPIWEDLASIWSKRFHFIQFHAHHSTLLLFHSSPFHSLPLHSIAFHSTARRSIPFHSNPFHCYFTPCRSGVPGFWNSGVGCFRDTDVPVSRPRASNRPRRDARSVNNAPGPLRADRRPDLPWPPHQILPSSALLFGRRLLRRGPSRQCSFPTFSPPKFDLKFHLHFFQLFSIFRPKSLPTWSQNRF